MFAKNISSRRFSNIHCGTSPLPYVEPSYFHSFISRLLYLHFSPPLFYVISFISLRLSFYFSSLLFNLSLSIYVLIYTSSTIPCYSISPPPSPAIHLCSLSPPTLSLLLPLLLYISLLSHLLLYLSSSLSCNTSLFSLTSYSISLHSHKIMSLYQVQILFLTGFLRQSELELYAPIKKKFNYQ